MSTLPRRHQGASGASGPLLVVEHTTRVVLGEWVRVEIPGQPPRTGSVIDAGETLTVVQIMEDAPGLAPGRATVTLTGRTPQSPVGRELLGRVLGGIGQPRDGLPPPVGAALRPLQAAPLNPVRRLPPSDHIETGISAIDGLNTLVRGQKLPVFAGAGLPALELAAQVVDQARAPLGEPFAVVFAALGITERQTAAFLAGFEASGALSRSVVYLNKAADPTIERLLTPHVALAAAEHLAFEEGVHVLVVMADLTAWCEALREIGAAREEVPGRRGYPGAMYTELAGIFERAGILAGRPGSLTQLPVLTMPDDDITHPIPDLTGYITEGQIVLSRDLHQRGISPPIDVLPSLSRLMNAGIGPGRTVPEHRRWANQLYALYARGAEARAMSGIVGRAGLSAQDRRALDFAEAFEARFIGQQGRRSLAQTIEAGWSLLETLPRGDLLRLDAAAWAAREARR